MSGFRHWIEWRVAGSVNSYGCPFPATPWGLVEREAYLRHLSVSTPPPDDVFFDELEARQAMAELRKAGRTVYGIPLEYRLCRSAFEVLDA